MKISLQYKLLAAFMTVVILVLAGVSVGGAILIRDYFLASKRHELTDKSYEMARMVNAYYDGHITHSQLHSFVNSVDSFLDARVWVVDSDLNLITVSAERPDPGTDKNRRPTSVIKPSPMSPAAVDCNQNGYQGGMMMRRIQPQQGQTTSKQLSQQQRQRHHDNTSSGQQAPSSNNDGKTSIRPDGAYNCLVGGGGDCSGASSAQPVQSSCSASSLMPLTGSESQLQTGQPAANDQAVLPPVIFDLGRELPPSKASGVTMSLDDITGMTEIIQVIQDNAGQTWAKSYYHPYYEENMLIVAAPFQRSDGMTGGTVMINAPLTEFDGFLQHVYTYLGYAGLAAILLAALLAAYIARDIVQPLKAMQQTAAAMARGDYAQRVSVAARDEVGELGNSLNSLAQDLGEYVRQMEVAANMRRDFVANVSHELRTPLTIIRGYNQALQDGAVTDPEKVKKYHRVMGDEMVRLANLITDLLDLSQLQGSGVILETEEVPLAEVIENVITLLKQKNEEKGVVLTSTIDADVLPIRGDGDRLTQLVLILMDNALKFTPAGGQISVCLTEEQDDTVLTIADTGVGIAPEDQPYVWERFYKADKSRASGGTGLGLAIARQIIELHGATVNVISACGKGTTFTIRF